METDAISLRRLTISRRGAFMRDCERGAVLAFPACRLGRRSSAGNRGRKAVVLPLRPTDRAPDEDPSFNPAWDEISKLASDAWTWRDPESLARLEECVAQLSSEVERDWDPRAEPARRAPRARR
jgi:hypothetical protein